MTRETWRTWILVGVVAVLGAGAIAEQARDRRRAPKPMMQIEFSALKQIERECNGCARLVAMKRQGTWELTQPWYAPADAEKLAQLVAIPASPLRRLLDPAPADPAAIGLAPPFATLKLDAHVLELGAVVPPQQDRYLRIGGRVGIVQDRFAALLTGPPESFVDPRPLAALATVGGNVLGQPMTPEMHERWRKLVAARIEPLPRTFPGHTLDFTLANGKRQVFQFDLRGDELALLRQGVRVLYIVDAKQRDALGFSH